MCRLIETIKVFKREFFNLRYHNERLNNARKIIFGCSTVIDLSETLTVPDYIDDGLHKCRIIYDKDLVKIEFIKYQFKSIGSLKLIHSDNIEYMFKFEDRSGINKLYDERSGCDDILIIKKNMITDTSFSNIIFYDGSKWLTPAKPLLKGTKRQKLIDDKRIFEEELFTNDLKRFKKAKIINSMIDPEDLPDILIDNIIL